MQSFIENSLNKDPTLSPSPLFKMKTIDDFSDITMADSLQKDNMMSPTAITSPVEMSDMAVQTDPVDIVDTQLTAPSDSQGDDISPVTDDIITEDSTSDSVTDIEQIPLAEIMKSDSTNDIDTETTMQAHDMSESLVHDLMDMALHDVV